MQTLIKNIYRKLKRTYREYLGHSPRLKIQHPFEYEYHGNENYGGWAILKNSLHKDSLVYSVGIGTDISFDFSIIKKYNNQIFAFDPTPSVNEWISKQNTPPQFRFYNIGLSNSNILEKFYLPSNPSFVSHSSRPTSENSSYIEVPMKNLSSIMESLNHQKIDVLKMDIEGFEFKVINNWKTPPNTQQLLVEFHHGMYGFKVEDTINAIKHLNSLGFYIFFISNSGYEYSFIKL